MGILRALFPVPKEDAKRVMTFANEADFISFRCGQPSFRQISHGYAAKKCED